VAGPTSKRKPAKKKPAKKRRKPAVAPQDKPLTPKQEAFTRWYVSAAVNFNGTEAARRAGYQGSANVLAGVAFDNLRKPNIAKEVDRLKTIALSGADVTVEAVLRRIAVVGAQALEAGKFGPAARCAELHGRYLKMFTDKIEHTVSIDEVTDEQLAELVKEFAEAAGVDISQFVTLDGTPDVAIPVDQGAPAP